jgi:hypothetical protein
MNDELEKKYRGKNARYEDTISAFASRNQEKPRRTSVRIVSVPAEV